MTTYPGGKNGSGVYQTIINRMPPHRVYIEPFLGGGAIMRAKRPAEINIGMDIDPNAVKLWKDHQIPGLHVFQSDALEYLAAFAASAPHNNPDTMIYLDPPYLLETRSHQLSLIYQHEFCTPEQHSQLLSVIKQLRCMVMISGYWSQLYADELSTWRIHTFTTTNRAGKLAIERLWMNYPETQALHDYRYLGCNYREREIIKRKQKRWTARLKRMSPLERQAMLAAIEETR